MSASAVGELYDALFTFEAKRRGGGAYPVHKRLCFAGEARVDIYDWLADRLRLGSADRVLDVGCGVGFGTIRLAERGVAHATGLTVSAKELERAQTAAAASPRSADIRFMYGSFDRLPREAFDVVVAVESLKHSADLEITLHSILASVAPGGRAVIVEDLLVGDPTLADARHVVGDWLLTRLYAEADYRAGLAGTSARVVDLTSAVPRRGRLVIAAELGAVNAALAWPATTHMAALRAFRGGLHLERLYATGAMRYKALFLSKDGRELL